MEITQISGQGIENTLLQEKKLQEPASASPGKFLTELVAKTDELQKQSDLAIQKIATGGEQGLHEAMLDIQKADLSFQYLLQVRNKAVEGYQEIMRMNV